MLFYLFVFFCAIFLAFLSDMTGKRIGIFFVLCVVLLLSYIGGMRDVGVGTDTMVYSKTYYYDAKQLSSVKGIVEEFKEGKDLGYLLLNLIGVNLSAHLWMCHFIIQLFTHGLIFFSAWFMKRTIPLKISLFTLAYCCVFYNQTYNFMRQYCALALLFLGLYFVLRKRWKPYLVCQVGAFFFHSTSVLFIFVPFLYYILVLNKNMRWRYWISGLLMLSVLVASFTFYGTLEMLNYMDIVSDIHAERYDVGDKFGARSVIRISFVFIVCAIFYFIYVAYKRKKIDFDLTVYLLSLHVFSIALYCLSFYSVYLYRLSLYYYLPVMLFTTIIVSSKKTLHIERIGWICMLLLDWYIYVVRHNGAGSFPYHSNIIVI